MTHTPIDDTVDTERLIDAIRNVTARVQNEIDAGRRSARIDAHDVVEILLAIVDRLEAGDSAENMNRPADSTG